MTADYNIPSAALIHTVSVCLDRKAPEIHEQFIGEEESESPELERSLSISLGSGKKHLSSEILYIL